MKSNQSVESRRLLRLSMDRQSHRSRLRCWPCLHRSQSYQWSDQSRWIYRLQLYYSISQYYSKLLTWDVFHVRVFKISWDDSVWSAVASVLVVTITGSHQWMTFSWSSCRWCYQRNWFTVFVQSEWRCHLSNSKVIDDQVAVVSWMSDESLGWDFFSLNKVYTLYRAMLALTALLSMVPAVAEKVVCLQWAAVEI